MPPSVRHSSLSRRPPTPALVALWLLCCGLIPAAEPTLDDLVVTDLAVLPHDIIDLEDRDPVFGEIVEVIEGERLIYHRQDSNIAITVPWSRVRRLQRRRTAEEVVQQRGTELAQALAIPALRSAAENEVVRLHRWARERSVEAASRDALLAVLEHNPEHQIVLEATVDLLIAVGDDDTLERILRAGIDRRSTWRRGFEELARLLQRGNRQEDLITLVSRWIEQQPTNATANDLMALIAEDAGDLVAALEAHRKLYAHHRQLASGLRFVRLSLNRGNHREAARVTEELLVADPNLPGLAVVAGAVALAQGELDRARSLLLADDLDTGDDPELALLLHYNRAWLQWQAGDHNAAIAAWETIDHPAATLALALARRQRIHDRSLLDDPILGDIARISNAALLLEREQPDQARRLLGQATSDRQLTLQRIATMQSANYTLDTVQALGDRRDRDAILWRAYGLIKNGAFQDALLTLKALPQDDGWASVYRLFCAEALGNEEEAANWYRIALKATNAPRGYLNHLTAFYYRSRDDREFHETFDWTPGEVLGVGWFREARGTNITIRATGEALAFAGVQTASAQPISRAWCVRPRAHVRRVSASISPGDTPGAVGLELLDDERANGLAIAVLDGGPLSWRRLRGGSWSEWVQLLDQAPSQWSIWIDGQQHGDRQIQLLTQRDQIPLTALYDLPGEMVGIGFFVEAPVGALVEAQYDDLRIQLTEADEEPETTNPNDTTPRQAPSPRRTPRR